MFATIIMCTSLTGALVALTSLRRMPTAAALRIHSDRQGRTRA